MRDGEKGSRAGRVSTSERSARPVWNRDQMEPFAKEGPRVNARHGLGALILAHACMHVPPRGESNQGSPELPPPPPARQIGTDAMLCYHSDACSAFSLSRAAAASSSSPSTAHARTWCVPAGFAPNLAHQAEPYTIPPLNKWP